jgi:hypothetical protein
MKTLSIFIFLFCIISCSKVNDNKVLNLDQLNGTWKWESTCGGLVSDCGYSSSSHYANIEFTGDGRIVEKHNDTIFLTANFSILKNDDSSGMLILNNIISNSVLSEHIEYSISISNNELHITRGELIDTYKKTK